MKRLSLLVISTPTYDGINRLGSVIRCSFQPGWETDFERTVFQKVNWPSENSSQDELKIYDILCKKLSYSALNFIDYPFKEVIKEENENESITNGSFIHFDFSPLKKKRLDKVLSRDLEEEPINCEELVTTIDTQGIDKRFPSDRFFKYHKYVDVPDPILHAHSCVRTCYLSGEEK